MGRIKIVVPSQHPSNYQKKLRSKDSLQRETRRNSVVELPRRTEED